MDHRGSMQRLIDPEAPSQVGYATVVSQKHVLRIGAAITEAA